MKWWKTKRLAGYIFQCCIAVVSSSLLLAGFVVKSQLAVLLLQLTDINKNKNAKSVLIAEVTIIVEMEVLVTTTTIIALLDRIGLKERKTWLEQELDQVNKLLRKNICY